MRLMKLSGYQLFKRISRGLKNAKSFRINLWITKWLHSVWKPRKVTQLFTSIELQKEVYLGTEFVCELYEKSNVQISKVLFRSIFTKTKLFIPYSISSLRLALDFIAWISDFLPWLFNSNQHHHHHKFHWHSSWGRYIHQDRCQSVYEFISNMYPAAFSTSSLLCIVWVTSDA